ncbi:hypothetical protein Y032_0139g2145 [Ancylostoma ceylanicum]|nr:hypothetical protein Y032_0139g2145 [Ancylostoma ceylanicum]
MRAKRALGKVNWTKYFLNLAPRNLHAYFSNDPLVAVNKTSIQVIDKILRTTPEKVIVNYTILSYVVTFIEFFSDKYQQIFQNLLPKFPSKADFCFKTTYNGFRDALIAEYARRTNGSYVKHIVHSTFSIIIFGEALELSSLNSKRSHGSSVWAQASIPSSNSS